MSIALPEIRMKTSDVSQAAHPPTNTPKLQRVLACVSCQQRKVRCDRNFPCANCIKSRTQCIPATQVSRRKRRRLPERDLLQRLRKYEDLLRQNNVKFEPLHKDPSEDKEPLELEGRFESDDEQPKSSRVDPLTPSTAVNSERVYEAK